MICQFDAATFQGDVKEKNKKPLGKNKAKAKAKAKAKEEAPCRTFMYSVNIALKNGFPVMCPFFQASADDVDEAWVSHPLCDTCIVFPDRK